jgi:proteasome component ECM29
MAGAAVALGRSDVLYALLLLSVSHRAWFTSDARDRYSAAALLGESSLLGDRTNTIEIRNALRPHIGKLIPRLLRAKHDPNKQTREQMEILWLGLTGGGAEARQTITDHLLPTIDSLIEDAQSKLWRARVGSCGALSEVIVARSWRELGGGGSCLEDDEVIIKTSTSNTSAAVRLLRLWRVAMRAIDDVREAVRESGEVLARSVKGLTIRLCDPDLALRSSKNAIFTEPDRLRADEETQAASSTSLRYLVKNGLDQKCAEAAGVCVSCLTGIVEIVRPSTLEPVLPELVGSLLMAMSGLEPAALNYFQVRAAGRESSETYDRLEHARIQFAQSGPIAQALNRCLEMVPLVDLPIQQLIVPQLDSALRGGAGFATRAATADAVSTLSHSCASAFKFPGISSTNPTVRLLRALYFASERERGIAAKDKMSHALGNLASLSPGPTVRSLAVRACDRYSAATGNNDNASVRRAAAAAVRSIVVRAPNQVADGGPKEIWSRKVLPVAFLGKKDKDSKIASLWKEVWDEGGASVSVGRSTGFGSLVEERVLHELVMACVDALDDVSWARRVAGATALSELCDIYVLSPLSQSAAESGSIQSPTETERARKRAKAACMALKACVTLLVKPRIWSGKTEVVKATINIATKWALIDEVSITTHGWNEEGPCPWLPITMGPRGLSVDLFEGDEFFEKSVEINGYEMKDEEKKQEEEKGNDGDSTIDFSEGDKILSQSNPDSREETSGEHEWTTVSFRGLCRALVNLGLPQAQGKPLTNSQDEVLPFRAAALEGVSNLLKAAKVPQNSRSSEVLAEMYVLLAPQLLTVIDSEGLLINGSEFIHGQPPLIVARATQCLSGLIWSGIGESGEAKQDVRRIAQLFQNIGGAKQGAWTIREAALLGTSELAAVCPVQSLRNHELLSLLFAYSNQALQDRKFWRVRVAGLALMKALVSRAGTGNRNLSVIPYANITAHEVNEQMMLEALLPFKEDILRTARSALKDSQSEVTAMASDVCGLVAWWI